MRGRLIQHIIILVLIFGLSFLLLTYSTGQINITYDSQEYLHAASTFNSSGKLLTKEGEPFTNWAPLFPLILSAFGSDAETYRYFNFLVYLLFGFAAILLIQNFIQDKKLQIICSIWLAFSTPILMQFNFLWSESLFITILTFKILFLVKFQETANTGYYLALIALGVLLCLQRYAGLFIVPAFVIMLIDFKLKGRQSFARGLIYGIVAAGPILIWMGINYEQKGIGFSAFASNLLVNFFPNLIRSYYQDIFFSWFLPNRLVFGLGHYYAFVLIIVIIVARIKTTFRFTRQQMILVTISITYFLFLLIIDYSALNDTVNDFSYLSDMERYLAVLHVPVVLLIFSLLDQKVRINQRTVLIILIIWSLYPTGRAIKNTMEWKNYSGVPESLNISTEMISPLRHARHPKQTKLLVSNTMN